ncbi:hypothetical protein NXW45_08825 [Bacteroides caccae]|jgi:hypothetical protein|uniref:hypothetical protein n=1 Tax=Bacteroides caccae TaxID=47678 RepID=UPI002165BF8A|nr:hypothetical protein [Bacteroides caccae]MCS2366469.1 hypothetical protein [Bacteroides caccae]MCS3190906.1 hypothetical protein [Bacteroides caccae]
MIARSNFIEIQANPAILHLPANRNVQFFFNEKEAYDRCPLGYRAIVAQWDMILDDATEEELAALRQIAEERIMTAEQESIDKHGTNYVNDAQRELIRRLYNHVEVYSCWYKSEEECEKDLYKGMRFNTFGDEVDDNL